MDGETDQAGLTGKVSDSVCSIFSRTCERHVWTVDTATGLDHSGGGVRSGSEQRWGGIYGHRKGAYVVTSSGLGRRCDGVRWGSDRYVRVTRMALRLVSCPSSRGCLPNLGPSP